MRCTNQPNRKASLSISTNAIVVLIIAVIMLGLIIGLVTQAFGAVEARFLDQIEQEPDPAGTSTGTPITINKDSLRGSPGELVGMKVRIRNLNGTSDEIRPFIECPTNPTALDNAYEEQVLGQSIVANQEGQFLFSTRISDSATEGTYLCRVLVVNESETDESVDYLRSAYYDESNNFEDETHVIDGIRPTEINLQIS